MAYVDDVHYGLDVQVDAADFVQVAYISSGNTDTSLFYVYRDPNSQNWSQEFIVDGYTADTSDNFDDTSVGYQVEMAIDSQNLRFSHLQWNTVSSIPFDFTDDIVGFATGSNGVYIPLDNFSLYELVYDRGPNMYSGTHISSHKMVETTHTSYTTTTTPTLVEALRINTPDLNLSTNSGVGLVSDPLASSAAETSAGQGKRVQRNTVYTQQCGYLWQRGLCCIQKWNDGQPNDM